MSNKTRFLISIFSALLIAIALSHALARWTKLPRPRMTCRRIGPTDGPQAYCAGSSDVQFGLGWPELSEALGRGIESCTLVGSSPAEWEGSETRMRKADPIIIGVGMNDLNENYLCEFRANLVPITQAIRDLRQTDCDWSFSRRVLGQYPMTYLQYLFPTAGKSDRVLVGARRKLLEIAHLPATQQDQTNFLVLPAAGVLKFGYSKAKLSAWPADQAVRRLAGLRGEIHGAVRFGGPKKLAFFRMLQNAQQHARLIVAIMPVAPMYSREFVTPEVNQRFENLLAEAQRNAPQAQFLRLDKLPQLNSDDYFGDFIHLNGAGRGIVTEAFLKQLRTYAQLP